jgi:predicted Zn-dependent protease
MNYPSRKGHNRHNRTPAPPADPVDLEWRRLLRQCRRHGAPQTARRLAIAAGKDEFPLWYVVRFAEYLLKRGQFSTVKELLDSVNRSRTGHPLIDQVYGKLLWSTGHYGKAIAYVKDRARLWSKSFLYSLLSSMYALRGNDQEARACLRTAADLAEKELKHQG